MTSRLRIVVHDYSGHPFQVQLSRALASRGHEVLHLFSSRFETPHGDLARRPADPEGFSVEGVDLGAEFRKYDYLRRHIQERRYGRLVSERIGAFAPDVVISGNTPLDGQAAITRFCRTRAVPSVFWCQDLYSVAITRHFRAKLPVVGPLIGAHYRRIEAKILRDSDAVVGITEDFEADFRRMGVAPGRSQVVPNWAPLDAIAPASKTNDWAYRHGLADRTVLLYSGTLGLKHNPHWYVALARALADRPEVRIVVLSQGPGAELIRAHIASEGLGNLVVLPFQDFSVYAQVLASADVLLAQLEASAGTYSVPSKILSYLAAGRAIIAAVPQGNLAARLLVENDAGIVVAPDDAAGFVAAARDLLGKPERRAAMARNGRAYAERTFDIEAITDRFEAIIDRARRSAKGIVRSNH